MREKNSLCKGSFVAFLLLLFLLIAFPHAEAQTVTGRVVDGSTGQNLEGVSVTVKGTQEGVTTNVDGLYSITVNNTSAALHFSIVGYASLERRVSSNRVINVELNPVESRLNEVVVVGYGEQKRETVTGSVVSVKGSDIVQSPVENITNALAGRLPGAIIQQRQGRPGDNAASFLIRGTSTFNDNSPLIVVDGVPDRDITTINPNDVESVTVLKDAAAAIYGARSANGVILVTTKKGKKDTPAQFDYSFYQGWQTPTEIPKMAHSWDYAQMIREYQSYDGIPEANMRWSQEDVDKFKAGTYPWTHPDNQWWDVIKTPPTQKHNFTLSGGTEKLDYFLSYGFDKTGALFVNSNSGYKRNNLRARIGLDATKYLRFDLDMSGVFDRLQNGLQDPDEIFDIILQSPTYSIGKYPNGAIGPARFGIYYNPYVMGSNDFGFTNTNTYQSNNRLSATFKVPHVDGLSATAAYSFDAFFSRFKQQQHNRGFFLLDRAAYDAAGYDGSQDGSEFLVWNEPDDLRNISNTWDFNNRQTFNARIDYTKTFSQNHHFSAFVAYEFERYYQNGISANRQHMLSNALPYLFAAPTVDQSTGETVDIDGRASYFGRINYDYKNKYLLQLIVRRDGSLRFAKESGRWGTFPSLSAGWIVSNEDWWHMNNFNFLKVRGSWGQLGNDLITPFQYLSAYNTVGSAYQFGSESVTSIIQANVPNPNITWERANIYNFGISAEFFDHKLTFDGDVFYQRRSDILLPLGASVPDFSGLQLPDENFGIVDSRGFELQLGYHNNIGEFTYSFNGNVNLAKNKAIQFDEAPGLLPWQVRTGKSMELTLLYKSAGIFRDQAEIDRTPHVATAIPGDIIIEDVSGDGIINGDDRILLRRSNNPELTFGFNFHFTYKGFALDALFSGTGQAWFRRLGQQQGSNGNYYQFNVDGRWTPENPDAKKPRAYNAFAPYWRNAFLTDFSFQNNAYLRLKNVQLSYTLPNLWARKVGMKNASIFVSGNNLALMFSHKDQRIFDPEFSEDRDHYPLMKTYGFGANLTF